MQVKLLKQLNKKSNYSTNGGLVYFHFYERPLTENCNSWLATTFMFRADSLEYEYFSYYIVAFATASETFIQSSQAIQKLWIFRYTIWKIRKISTNIHSTTHITFKLVDKSWLNNQQIHMLLSNQQRLTYEYVHSRQC